MRVAPNPFASRIAVLGLAGDARVELHSADGFCSLSERAEAQQEVNLIAARLQAGVYLLRSAREGRDAFFTAW